MTTYSSYFSHRITLSPRLISVLILAGCALLQGLRVPVSHPKTVTPANPLPDLRGQAAVEHLKQEGLYASLAEAVAAARYNANPLPLRNAYQFSNPAQCFRATFTSSYPLTIDPHFAQQVKLRASNSGAGTSFGASIAISGNTVAVGRANGAESNFGLGEAYIFVRSGTTWREQQILTSSDSMPFDFFGDSVAISDDTVVVGAPRAITDGNIFQGSAYIFVRSGTTWTQRQKLTASDSADITQFGISVAISGDTAAVGAGGAAYIFVRSGTNWSEQRKLTASDGAAFTRFGASVAISGDTVAVGAPFPDFFPNPEQGAAYIFVRSGMTWTQQQKLVASDGAAGDLFGLSVSISGDTVVVGAPQADIIGGNANQGAAYVFVRGGTTWAQQDKLTATDGMVFDQFGFSVAITGDTVVVGAFLADIGMNENQGEAYVFVRSGTTWSEQQKLNASDGETFDFFGASVAISGDRAVVGAIGDDFFSGSVYLFMSPCPEIIINPTNPVLPVGKMGQPYSQIFTTSGGTAPLGFTVITGALPSGLTLTSDGILSGTPTDFGTFTFTVHTIVANDCAGARDYTVTIAPSAFATVSAANFTSPVAAKEIVAGFGVSLANTTAFPSSLTLPTSLAGTNVMVKDSAGVERASPLYFISPLQINYQIPADTALGAATVSVFVDPVLVAVGAMQIVTTAPSIFTLNANGSGPAAALDAITFLPAPFNATLADGSPNFIAVFGTGLGADATDGGGDISASVQALIDGNPVAVTYAGQAPFFVGANQFNIRFPAGITSGVHTLTISRGGVTSNAVTIAIR